MPTATIQYIFCVSPSTGTDGGVNAALVNALTGLTSVIEPVPGDPRMALREVPGLIGAIDRARQDPDNLYMTTGTVGDVDQAIWPGSGQTIDIRKDQGIPLNLAIPFTNFLNLSLWDEDGGFLSSGDDPLGSITISDDEERGVRKAKKAMNAQEVSLLHHLSYRLNAPPREDMISPRVMSYALRDVLQTISRSCGCDLRESSPHEWRRLPEGLV